MNPVDIAFIVGLVIGLIIATVIGAIVFQMIHSRAADQIARVAGARGYQVGWKACHDDFWSSIPDGEASLPPGMCAHRVALGRFCPQCWEGQVEEAGQ